MLVVRAAQDIGALFEHWQDGPLSSYLIEVSAAALQSVDPQTGQPMVDVILDQAGQKGTGRWTLIEALKMGQSASTIEAAVGCAGLVVGENGARAGRATACRRAPLVLHCPPMLTLSRRCLAGAHSGPRAGLSESCRRRRRNLIGRWTWPAFPRSGGRAASSARPCWTILPHAFRG